MEHFIEAPKNSITNDKQQQQSDSSQIFEQDNG